MTLLRHPLTTLLCAALLVGCAESTPRATASDIVARGDTAVVELETSCADCTLRLVDSLQLGTPADSVIPLREPNLLRDSRGNHYLTFHGWGSQLIMQYDSSGEFKRRVGVTGRGPGEYVMTSTAHIGVDDSLYVFTWDRVLLVYSAAGDFVRSVNVKELVPVTASVTTPIQFLALRPNRLAPDPPPVYVMQLNALGELKDSVAIFSPIDRSMWTERQVEGKTVRAQPRVSAAITTTPQGGFWTLNKKSYRLEWHDSLGTPRKLLGVRTTEQPDPLMTEAHFDAAAEKQGKQTAPGAMVRRVVVSAEEANARLKLDQWLDIDSAGLLWVTRHVPAPSYDTISLQTEYRAKYEAPSEGTIPLSVEDRRAHSVVDVIDPETGTRLAQLELPFRAVRVRAGVVGRLTEDQDGFIITRMYTLALTRGARVAP